MQTTPRWHQLCRTYAGEILDAREDQASIEQAGWRLMEEAVIHQPAPCHPTPRYRMPEGAAVGSCSECVDAWVKLIRGERERTYTRIFIPSVALFAGYTHTVHIIQQRGAVEKGRFVAGRFGKWFDCVASDSLALIQQRRKDYPRCQVITRTEQTFDCRPEVGANTP